MNPKPELISYDAIGRYIGEIYDSTETQTDDVELLLSLIGEQQKRILEPFCGSGRILLPLVEAGHEVHGIDRSEHMLQVLETRVQGLPSEMKKRVTYVCADVTQEEWPCGFDVVVLGANCLYELATPQQQERCIARASESLCEGGHLFLDSNHMEGGLDVAWQDMSGPKPAFPSGICSDGTRIKGTRETIWFDVEKRLVRFRQTATVESPNGEVRSSEWIQQKHPPSTEEMCAWLTTHSFAVEHLWGDRNRSDYSSDSGRAVFWARKT